MVSLSKNAAANISLNRKNQNNLEHPDSCTHYALETLTDVESETWVCGAYYELVYIPFT